MAKIIQTRRQPMTCWRVLHKTTTMKVKGSIMGVRECERERERNEGGGRGPYFALSPLCGSASKGFEVGKDRERVM